MRIRWATRVATLLLAGLWACRAAPAPAPERVVVATWNIHHGRGLDGEVDVDRIAELLRATGADIVALQEVDVGVERSGRIDLARELADRLGMTAVFGKNIDFQGGDYGNAILTRHRIESWRNHHYRMLREGEQRGLLIVRTVTPGGALTVMATHIDYRPDDQERLANIAEIDALLATEPGPTVVCGDFNDLPDSRVHAAAMRNFFDAWGTVGQGGGATYPAGAPRKRIDWVLTDQAGNLRPTRAWVPDSDASDHLPVVVELEWAR